MSLSRGLNPKIDKQVVQMYKDGMTMREIGEAFGKSRQWARNRIIHYGLKPRQNLAPQQHPEFRWNDRIMELWNAGLNLREISEVVPLSTTTIRVRLREAGVVITTRQPQRIDPDEALEMGFLYERMKMDSAEIARHYGYKSTHAVFARLAIAGVKIRSRSEINKLNYAKGNHPACLWENGMRTRRKKTLE